MILVKWGAWSLVAKDAECGGQGAEIRLEGRGNRNLETLQSITLTQYVIVAMLAWKTISLGKLRFPNTMDMIKVGDAALESLWTQRSSPTPTPRSDFSWPA